MILKDAAEQRKTHHQTIHSMYSQSEQLKRELTKVTKERDSLQEQHDLRKAAVHLSPFGGLVMAFNYFFGKKQ